MFLVFIFVEKYQFFFIHLNLIFIFEDMMQSDLFVNIVLTTLKREKYHVCQFFIFLNFLFFNYF